MYRPKYFSAKELVTPHVYNAYGEDSVRFIDENILKFLDKIRERYGKPIIVNSYGRNLTQRCLRDNISAIVKDKTINNKLYLSAHSLGRAVDFEITGKPLKEVYDDIRNNPQDFPEIQRMETGDYTLKHGYIHVDTIPTPNWNRDKDGIYIFKV